VTASTADLLVIGGGIVGLAAALEAKRRGRGRRVVVLEKEPAVARHASGRNSGVLHAGLYYAPGGLKARFTREGCARLTDYCLERGLPINRCGKLIVATEPAEQVTLDELLRRGRANGVELHEVDEAAARELEPAARVRDRAVWVPATASVDPAAVTASLAADAREVGIDVRTGEAFLDWRDGVVVTSRGRWSAGYVLNTAGVHADSVARRFGFGEGYRIMPFKGRYLRSTRPVGVTRHIYPVPDLRYPFLGVHFTVAVDGSVWIGPTAGPALGREQYGVGVGIREAAGTLLPLARLLMARHNPGLRRLARLEIRRRWPGALLREARRLARNIPPGRAWAPGRPGIRAQLVDTRRLTLEDDFVYQADDRSLHVLNAVSPAFTCALPLAEHLMDAVEVRQGG
jgi:(S)-2-hydroxyglutarate dehydrogenase